MRYRFTLNSRNARQASLFALCVAALLQPLPAGNARAAQVSAEDAAKIEAALPGEAPAKPLKPRRLLIFTRNVGYGGHPSMAHASHAFAQMGRKTGAFETEVTDDPVVFERNSLARFDAVFFNNTVGNCFTNADLRRNLMEFVTGGGGLLGVHGSTVAFTHWPGATEDWPEFGYLIGARGANHKASDEHVYMKLDDLGNPVTAVFDKAGFDFRDEFFRPQDPYSRKRVRVLLSIDTNRTDVSTGRSLGNTSRADNDYAVAWIRNHGRGRVFYSTIAHNPYVFWDKTMLQFYLRAVQFALGDLPAPTTPSAWITPSVLAQEKLGWKLGIEAYTFHKYTFFESVEKTAALNIPFIGGLSFQKVGGGIDKNFDADLNGDELVRIRMKLHEAGLRLLTFYVQELPGEEAACRKWFEFGRKMGIETFISEPKLEALPVIDRLCQEYGIRVGLHNHAKSASPNYWSPEKILAACKDRSPLIGAAADVGYWQRGGIDPAQGIRQLGNRLITLQLHDLDSKAGDAHDVPWGSGVSDVRAILAAVRDSGAKPVMIGLEYSHNFTSSLSEIEKSAAFYNQTVLQLAQ